MTVVLRRRSTVDTLSMTKLDDAYFQARLYVDVTTARNTEITSGRRDSALIHIETRRSFGG